MPYRPVHSFLDGMPKTTMEMIPIHATCKRYDRGSLGDVIAASKANSAMDICQVARAFNQEKLKAYGDITDILERNNLFGYDKIGTINTSNKPEAAELLTDNALCGIRVTIEAERYATDLFNKLVDDIRDYIREYNKSDNHGAGVFSLGIKALDIETDKAPKRTSHFDVMLYMYYKK